MLNDDADPRSTDSKETWYQITVTPPLDEHGCDWLCDLSSGGGVWLRNDPSRIFLRLPDRAALTAVIHRLADLRLELIELRRTQPPREQVT